MPDRAFAGLSRLSVWWLKLGIQLERIEPGKPEQNGRNERMHRTLKQSTALPPRSTLEAQQRAFNEFKQEYNYDRPHEALRNRFPADLYAPSGRTFPEILPEVAYPTNMEIQKVNDAGNIICGGRLLFLTGALSGETVGLEEISGNHAHSFLSGCAWCVRPFYPKVLTLLQSDVDGIRGTQKGVTYVLGLMCYLWSGLFNDAASRDVT